MAFQLVEQMAHSLASEVAHCTYYSTEIFSKDKEHLATKTFDEIALTITSIVTFSAEGFGRIMMEQPGLEGVSRDLLEASRALQLYENPKMREEINKAYSRT
ncbi:hypothetical protein [Roseivivax sediminis]|uniref:hypothetical protein n=1 Tax=Roseivivax sediminis TaxID=936889 RepID=UPI00122CD02D|nr:hypothetical protein [Roseivivax sediminis]